MSGRAARWLKFNGAGIVGVGVQLVTLAALTASGIDYLPATMIAVETAVLHNFVWHERVTFIDRVAPGAMWSRLVKFNLSNGMISIVGNVVLMKVFVEGAGIHPVFANLLAIVICSTANFAVSEWLVFAPRADLRG